ncbi:MAG: Mitochondrial-processing peptidase subunit alpha [Peltula sp. TS41687]|nr:MAG: Mitochondrial-processing peptidase subunit alpha [Peltula sp. TS41687]
MATVIEGIQKDPTELDQITTLSNGIRVATEALPGYFSAIGVYIDAGARYENHSLQGVSHIMDRLAFKSTTFRTSDETLELLESLGGNIQCASSRESLMYQSATFNSAVPNAVALLAETIRHSLTTEEEVQQQLETAEYEIGEIWSKPELILPELVHMAAYKDNTLGNSLLCPRERLSEIDKRLVDSYKDIFFRPERMVVAFAGVSHDEGTRLAEKYFGDMRQPASPVLSGIGADILPSGHSKDLKEAQSLHPSISSSSSQSSGILSKLPIFKNLSTSAAKRASVVSSGSSVTLPTALELNAHAHYTGGFLSLPPLPPPPNSALPRLSHIHLAFEGLPISSDEIYALATLQTLLGGGGSFSAGGPGKGMYSRLYTNVLNQHGWVENCVSFNHSYTDSGLFGISASCQPSKVSRMLEVMCRELYALTLESGPSSLQPAEVNRAKNALRSSLLMNMESRMVELEDLGRQVQVHGRKVGPREMCRRIEALTVQDLRRVASKVLGGLVKNPGRGSGAPTVVLQEGEEEGVRRKELGWDEIQERIARWKLGRR